LTAWNSTETKTRNRKIGTGGRARDIGVIAIGSVAYVGGSRRSAAGTGAAGTGATVISCGRNTAAAATAAATVAGMGFRLGMRLWTGL